MATPSRCSSATTASGGLLRYGIPEFKLEKKTLDRRLKQMEAEGVVFKTHAHVGVNVSVEMLQENYDAVVVYRRRLRAA